MAMHIALDTFRGRLSLPPTATWPDGVWDLEAFARGSMSLVLFEPQGEDRQTTHDQDELYVVVAGCGVLRVGEQRFPFLTGDVLFVPAMTFHRFEEHADGLAVWAIFWGPKGGEQPNGAEG
jgi:mannose-6-phosphate isomerase-like protein (cupin superfamily)